MQNEGGWHKTDRKFEYATKFYSDGKNSEFLRTLWTSKRPKLRTWCQICRTVATCRHRMPCPVIQIFEIEQIHVTKPIWKRNIFKPFFPLKCHHHTHPHRTFPCPIFFLSCLFVECGRGGCIMCAIWNVVHSPLFRHFLTFIAQLGAYGCNFIVCWYEDAHDIVLSCVATVPVFRFPFHRESRTTKRKRLFPEEAPVLRYVQFFGVIFDRGKPVVPAHCSQWHHFVER